MRRIWAALLSACLLACAAPAALGEDAATVGYAMEAIGLTTAFPAGWQVVTPETVVQNFMYFTESSPETAAANMRAEGVYAAAFSPSGDAVLRVIAREGDATIAQYYDIERYDASMRAAIKADFLDKSAWALTGYRYSEAEWSNREGKGRILNLTYTIRFGEETVARGLQAYTIRNGLAFTLDLQVEGSRKLSREEEKLFAAFVSDTVFPQSTDMPLFPVGLTLTSLVPEETDKAAVSLRGETTPQATVTATLLSEAGDIINAAEAQANKSGIFTLDFTLPSEGDWRLSLRAQLDGYETTEDARWISYNSKRLPVTFTSFPEGTVEDSQIIISGKTISGVVVQCMEGDTLKKTTTGSSGEFSFKMDRAIIGERTIMLSLSKKNYESRRYEITFNRQWAQADYVKYLSGQVQSLSFKSLAENAAKFEGRLVAFTGDVIDVSSVGERTYVHLGLKKDRTGAWTERIIGVADGLSIALVQGNRATLYGEVMTETYTFSEVDADGAEIETDLPAIRLLTYEKK